MLYAFAAIIFFAAAGIAFVVLRHLPEHLPGRESVRRAPSERVSHFADEAKQGAQNVRSRITLAGMKRLFNAVPSMPAWKGFSKPSASALQSIDLGEIKNTERNEDFWIGLIENDPENPYLYKKLGEFYLATHQEQYARDTFRYALKFAPNDETILAKLAILGEAPKKKEKTLVK